MTKPERVTINLSFTPKVASRLRALIEPSWTGLDDDEKLKTVVATLADHAQQAVYRPGAWERGWICQAFGEDWLGNLEPDPEHANLGWQRPRTAGQS